MAHVRKVMKFLLECYAYRLQRMCYVFAPQIPRQLVTSLFGFWMRPVTKGRQVLVKIPRDDFGTIEASGNTEILRSV